MVIFYLIEAVLLFGLLWLIATQMLIPATKGLPLFPLFSNERELKSKLVEQRQEFVEKELEQAVAENEQKLNSSESK